MKCPQCSRDVPADARECPWDGSPLDSIVGMTLGDYRVGGLLGAGGMGEVYAGEQPMIGKKVAIKVLKRDVAHDPANVKRMLAEARAVNSIRHRSIVDIFNFGTLPDGRPYLVMEYLEGTALDLYLRDVGQVASAEAAGFLAEICSALAAAHGRGIIHRDLKPANVFLVSDGSIRNRYLKLLDFGLAKRTAAGDASTQTGTGLVVGTCDYIAPEQATGGVITARTDLYSLGVMAYEILTGHLPFTGESSVEIMMAHVRDAPPHVRARVDYCPESLDALIFDLMAKEPNERPASAEQVRSSLVSIQRDIQASATMVAPFELSDRPTSKLPSGP